MLRHGSLFSGLGGFDQAAKWMGWQNVFQVEIDEYCRKVLEKHYPESQRFKDVKEFDGRIFRGTIDVLSGSSPCQPFSFQNKTRKGTGDSRYLWPEMFRIVREMQPTYILHENVVGSLSKILDQQCCDLEGEGYEVWPAVIPASAIGAKHRRERVWILAYNASYRRPMDHLLCENSQELTCSDSRALSVWSEEPPNFSELCGTSHGVFSGLYPHHIKRLQALGNSIVPQVAYFLFKGIHIHHGTLNRQDRSPEVQD